MLSAMLAYIGDGGKSRGSYLITDGQLPDPVETDTAHRDKVLLTAISLSDGVSAHSEFIPTHPIPTADNWFETIYNAFGSRELYD